MASPLGIPCHDLASPRAGGQPQPALVRVSSTDTINFSDGELGDEDECDATSNAVERVANLQQELEPAKRKMQQEPETEEGPPKQVAKVTPNKKYKSTGKTARMLHEISSEEREFFGVDLLKKIYEPGTGSSAYTENSPVNLHHPDYQKPKKQPKNIFGA